MSFSNPRKAVCDEQQPDSLRGWEFPPRGGVERVRGQGHTVEWTGFSLPTPFNVFGMVSRAVRAFEMTLDWVLGLRPYALLLTCFGQNIEK